MFVCVKCGKKYLYKSPYYRHLSEKHGVDNPHQFSIKSAEDKTIRESSAMIRETTVKPQVIGQKKKKKKEIEEYEYECEGCGYLFNEEIKQCPECSLIFEWGVKRW